ncbi:MAG: DUF1364 family protein [Rhizobiaceae bacterium]|nr:DUF1364 family protein [Rhizobiaceae bacterium]
MKSVRFRSKKLLKAARDKECTMQVESVCNYNTETTVAAHINVHGGKMGGKEHDFLVADCCSSCHSWLDQYDGSEEDRLFYTRRALARTWERRINEGAIVIK